MSKQTDLLNLTDAIDSSADATALTIDSSENVMVGTTTPTLYNVSSGTGLSYRNGIALDIARQNTGRSQPLINLNLTGADGDHLLFYKDGASIGNIGNISDDLIIYSTATNHSGLRFGQGYIFPVDNTGNTSDGVQDLGLSVGRYKDLYLSGGVYLGGTGSANKLEDFETGSCTLNWIGSGGTNDTTASFNYIKIGAMVNVYGNTGSTVPNATGALHLDGLPFNSNSNNRSPGAVLYRHLTPPSGAHTLVAYIGANSNNIDLYWSSSANYTQFNSSNYNTVGGADFYINLIYTTTS